MASTLSIGPEQQRLDGRTVRDIVEHDPAQVNEVWCRKIFRQILQSLELQYAMRMPHRAITPDTVVFHDNGEPLLLPTEVEDSGQDEAADLTALARLVHFAITRELLPAGPLRGRHLEGYSDSLITAVDRCMSADPAERPRSIDELRHILGIVSLGPAMPAAAPPGVSPTAPSARPSAASATASSVASASASSTVLPAMSTPVPVPLDAPFAAAAPDVKILSAAAPGAAADPLPSFMREPGSGKPPLAGGLSRWQRWAIAGGGGAFLLAVALALFAELRDSGSYDHIVLTLPQSGEQAHSDAASAPPPLAQAEPQASASQSAPQSAEGRQDGRAEPAPPAAETASAAPQAAEAAPQSQPTPADPVPAAARRLPPAAQTAAARPGAGPAASATYRLHIQPWGVVYVDGVDRGVSPPVKRLVLPPGRHTIRIANPNFHDRVLEVDTSAGGGPIAVDFSDQPK